MRFSNAAGFKQGLDKPWYSKADSGMADSGGLTHDDGQVDVPSKDVWGNEDPRRKQREEARAAASDPLAAMRQGAAGVRRAERERRRWKEERDREMVELLKTERERKERRKRRRRDDCDGYNEAHEEDDGLEGFSLDIHDGNTSSRHRRHSKEQTSGHRDSHRRSRHRDRDTSRDRDSDRHRRHHRH
jgi:hypothetical protein